MAEVKPFDNEHLMSIIERVEKLNEDERAIKADLKEVFGEAKSAGFDPRMIRWCVKMRAMDRDEIDELNDLQKMYAKAINL